MSIGYKIEQILKHNNITQKQFAESIGTTESAVSHWINGSRQPNIKWISIICRTYEVSADWLFDNLC